MTTTLFYIFDSVDQTGNTPVPDAQVRLYTSDGTTFVTWGQTDAAGELVLDVPDDTYWVRFFKTGYSFPSKRYIVVNALAVNNEFDIEAGNLEILPPSTADHLCRVSGYIVDAAGQPRSGATFQFMLVHCYRHIVGNRPIAAAKVIARSNKYGYFEVELVQGAFYEVVMEGRDNEVFVCQVPETQAANVTEVIWPYPARVELSANAVVIPAGDTEEVTVTLILSSGVVMPFPDDAPAGTPNFSIKAVSSDEAVARVEYSNRTQILEIEAVSAGSATISFEAAETYEERFPEIVISLEEIDVTVT
jgi:hypothetical protein